MASSYKWYSHVKEIVRLYPYRTERYDSLDNEARKECDAVAAACRLLDLEKDKDLRLQVITARHWSTQKRSLDLLEMDLFVSRTTMKRWDRAFLRNVAALLGVYSTDDSTAGV